jgi:hypothetical protein
MKQEENMRKIVEERFRDDSSVLQIRLNSDFVLERVKIYLTGKIQSVVYDKNGEPKVVEEQISAAKANDRGIQEILNNVQNIVNPQVVQGNFKFEMFQNYIEEVHAGLITDLMDNLHNWGIDEDDYEPIINKIMILIIPFISRLIENKERDSYAATIKAIESSSVQSGKFGMIKP